ncbi:MAG TPA: hypothetical protein VK687_05980 [Bryobacteraceae bacterium]|nr:hypothetical protein [Bryobacteraceae bacterium]
MTMAGMALAGTALAGTFGTRIQIGGQAADLALDEPRGVLYVADFTRNSIEIVSLAANAVVNSIGVDPNPSSLSVSPNGRWLLVTHFGNNTLPVPSDNVLSLIDLANHYAIQKFRLSDPPLGVAFGQDNLALVVTTKQFFLFDPQQGFVGALDTIANIGAKALPVPADSFPGDITSASVAASADGSRIYGMGSSTGTFTFTYDAASHTVSPGGVVLSSGVLGPRVVSMNGNGSTAMAGWIMIDSNGTFINNVPHTSNQFSVGTTAFDDSRGLVYAHIPAVTGEAPVLQILANDNLTVLDRLKLPENTTGKSVLRSDASVLYSISDSGVLVLPVGSLNASPRLAASATDLFFRGNFCDRAPASQTLSITDPGGGKTPFTITTSDPNVTVSPSIGTTPATVTVTVDPNAFLSETGTSTVTLKLASSTAVNIPPTVRVLINVAKPEQRGTMLNIPGTLVDILADPVRNRYYILRQDNNTVLIFDASNNTQITALRTYNVPTSMAITADNNLLLVGHRESQTLAVFDLNTLLSQPYIQTDAGGGHVVSSLAVSYGKILAAAVDYKNNGHVLSIDLNAGSATQLSTLGDWENKISTDAVVVASPDQSTIMVAGSDGNVFLYDAGVDTFTISRKDVPSLSGAYAAGNGVYMAGNNILDAELVPVASLDASSGRSSGFAFIGGFAAWTLAPDSASAGVMERVDFGSGAASTAVSTVEAPLLTTPILDFAPSAFTRTLAPLSNGTAIVSLTTSGVTIHPINFDAPVAKPILSRVVSAADLMSPVASGGLLTAFGSSLSSAPLAASQFPLPGVLGNSCLTFNNQSISLMFVSPGQINAQAPLAAGNGDLVLHVPGAVSDPFNLTILPSAPALFMNGGPAANLPVIIRADDSLLVTASHPVHHGDTLLIYLTGLGLTSPLVAAGLPAPSNPLAEVQIPVSATLGGVGLSVSSASLISGQAGVYQVSAGVPNNVPLGLGVPLTINQGGVSFTVGVRVVN